jgi:hypothetical protein
VRAKNPTIIKDIAHTKLPAVVVVGEGGGFGEGKKESPTVWGFMTNINNSRRKSSPGDRHKRHI